MKQKDMKIMNSYSSLLRIILVQFSLFLRFIHTAPSIDSHTSCGLGKMDLVLVVDVSSSVSRRFLMNREAALDVAKSMPIGWDHGVTIAVVEYSQQALTRLELDSSQTGHTVNQSISSMEWTGGVAYSAQAMDIAMVQFRKGRQDSTRVIVLFSDGNSLNTWDDVQATAERLRYSNARIYAVSLWGKPYEPELNSYIGLSNGTIVRNRTEYVEFKKELLELTKGPCRGAAGNLPDTKGAKLENRIKEALDKRDNSSEEFSTFTSTINATTPKHRHTKHHHPTRTSKQTQTTTTPTGSTSTVPSSTLPPTTSTITTTTSTSTTSATTTSTSTTSTGSSTTAMSASTKITTVSTTEFDAETREDAIRKMID